MSEGRREAPRTPIDLRVEYKRANSFFADYTKNISHGGTFIRTERPLPIGTEFQFELVVPGLEEPIRLRGKVQWLVTPEDADEENPSGMGIGFLHPSESEREMFKARVESLIEDRLGPLITRRLLEGADS